ncbi:MAG: hypothetical protein AAGC46_10005 [Solirubrobacteraceae bacterium]|nr:hypothetical protein [Patulibacter sp.]
MAPRKVPSDDQLREAFSEVGDALQRAVVLSSDRVQSVLEDAVLRGRMTRRDAEELATNLVALGREQALELRTEVDAIARATAGKVAEAVDPRARSRKRRERDEAKEEQRREAARFVSAEAFANGHRPKPATTPEELTGTGALPADPSKATAKELIALVATLSPPDLKTLRAQEAAGKARATVLKAIDQRTSA